MTKNDESELIFQILKMKDGGSSRDEIVNCFKQEETREFLDLIEKIESAKECELPEKAVLEKIFQKSQGNTESLSLKFMRLFKKIKTRIFSESRIHL